MTVKEYSTKRGVSIQSVYARLNRGTLEYEVIEGIRHIVDSTYKVKALTPIDRDYVSKVEKRLKKALKKGLKHKHKYLLAVNKLNSMDTLLQSKQSEIDSLKASLDLMRDVKRLFSPVEDTFIDADIKSKKKKSSKKKSKK